MPLSSTSLRLDLALRQAFKRALNGPEQLRDWLRITPLIWQGMSIGALRIATVLMLSGRSRLADTLQRLLAYRRGETGSGSVRKRVPVTNVP